MRVPSTPYNLPNELVDFDPLPPSPCSAWGIFDGSRLIENSGTGQLFLYYTQEDAEFALPAIQKALDGPEAKLEVKPVSFSWQGNNL